MESLVESFQKSSSMFEALVFLYTDMLFMEADSMGVIFVTA